MRHFINIVENAALVDGWQALWNDDFCEAVQKYIARNLGDWVEDYDTAEFDEMVAGMLRTIWNFAVRGGTRMLVYRKELRPASQVDECNFGSVGQFWSWTEAGAQVCHHENGYGEHGDDIETVMFEGTVDANDINWVATVAKNFILRNEREITVQADKTVAVERVFSHGDSYPVGKALPVRSNGHEDDF